MWTRFMDMHSGGGQKEKFAYCYIQAPIDEAVVIFYNRFGHSSDRVTCTCCGEDYSLDEHKTLSRATAYERGCQWDSKAKVYVEKAETKYKLNKFMKLVDYRKKKDVCIIPKADIKKSERIGDVPKEGYVWM